MVQARARQAVTGTMNAPMESIATRLKPASSPVNVHAIGPAPRRAPRRQSAKPTMPVTSSGTAMISKIPEPFSLTKVADPWVTVPEDVSVVDW
jgi:hypothetical protein